MPNTVKGNFSFVSAKDLTPFLGSGLRPLAQDFVEAGHEYGLDPRFLASISKLETANGTSRAFLKGNNAMGISTRTGPRYDFTSPRESIFAQARSLARPDGYYAKASTISQIGAIYAPPGASNDPRGTNGGWPSHVSLYYAEMTGGSGAAAAGTGNGDQGLRAIPTNDPGDTLEATGARNANAVDLAGDGRPSDALSMARMKPRAPGEPDAAAPETPGTPLIPKWKDVKADPRWRHGTLKERRATFDRYFQAAEGMLDPNLSDQDRALYGRKKELERLKVDFEDPEATIVDAFTRGALNTKAQMDYLKATKEIEALSQHIQDLERIKMKLRPGEAIWEGSGYYMPSQTGNPQIEKTSRPLALRKEGNAGFYAVPMDTPGAKSLEELTVDLQGRIHSAGQARDAAVASALENGELARALPSSRRVREFVETEGTLASAKVLARHFPSIAAHTLAESAAGIIAPVTGGMAAGPAGAAAGGFAVEYAAAYQDFLNEAARAKGLDPETPQGLIAAMENEEIVRTAKTRAVQRGVPIAAVDAMSGGIAHLLAKKIGTATAGRILGAAATQIGFDAAGGAGGEFAAQAASGQPISGKDAVLEGIGQVATGAGLGAARTMAEQLGRVSPSENESSLRQTTEAPSPEVPATVNTGPATAAPAPMETPVGTPRPLTPPTGLFTPPGDASMVPSDIQVGSLAPVAPVAGTLSPGVAQHGIGPVVAPSPFRSAEEFSNPDTFYRVISGEPAFRDLVESGQVRTDAGSKTNPNATMAEKLARRPTAFPSFSKGKAFLQYSGENDVHYIIESTDPSLQASTSGRHGKGVTYFPTDSEGRAQPSMDASKVRVYQHVGNGNYQMVYDRGMPVQNQTDSAPITATEAEIDLPGVPAAIPDTAQGALGVGEAMSAPGNVVTAPETPPVSINRAVSTGKGAGIEASLASPQNLPAARQQVAQVYQGAPVSLGDIRRYLIDHLDIPLRFGIRMGGKLARAAGIYKNRPEIIRLAKANDIATLAHEIGHHLHYTLLGPGRTTDKAGNPTATDFATNFDSELLPIGQASPTYQGTGLNGQTPDLARREGVAEWVSQWMMDRVAAKAAAPKFSFFFEATLDRKHPQVMKALREAAKLIDRYQAQPQEQKLEAQIAFDDRGAADNRSPLEWLTDSVRRAYTQWFDHLAPLTRMAKELERLGVPRSEARAFDRRAHNFQSGWASKAQADIELEQRDLAGLRIVGPSLRAILKGLDGRGRREFSMYLVAKRAQELAARGVETGVPPQSARTMRRWQRAHEARRQQLLRYQEQSLQLLVDAGLVSTEAADAMRQANQDYVPFYRLVERFGATTAGAGGLGKGGNGFVNLDAGIRKLKGSDLEIIDPLQSIVRNTMAFRQMAERNLVAREFVDAVQKARGGGKIADQIAAKRKPVQISHAQMVAQLKDAGIIQTEADLPASAADLAWKLWQTVHQPKGSDGEIVVHRKGKREHWQIMDREVYRALTLMDAGDVKAFQRTLPLVKVMAKATAILRTGATLTPEFILRNPVRDQLIAGINSRNSYVPFWDGLRGVLSVVGKDSFYRDWVAAGGSFSGPVSGHRADIQAYLSEHIKDRNALEQALHLANPKTWLAGLGKLSETMEAATRVSEFRKARQRGKGLTEAAMDAKDVTLDFSRHGPAGKAVNLMVAFFNAGLQDMDKIRREAVERPGHLVTKSLMYITLPTLALAALNADDDDIHRLPDWRRNFFWNINFGRLLGGESWILSVPKPFLLGAIFGTLPERAFDQASGRDPAGMRQAAQAIWQNTLFRGDLMASISVFRPSLENLINHSFFTGGPIVPQRMQNLEPRYQFDPGRTSEFARITGQALNVSPMKIDNAVRGHFAGLGRLTTDAIDYFAQKIWHESIPPRPEKTLEEMPGIRGFTQGPYTPSVYVDRFYKAMDLVEGRLTTFNKMGNLMTQPEQEKWWKENGGLVTMYGAFLPRGDKRKVISALRKVQDQIGEINAAMRQVYGSMEMTPEQKTEALVNLNQQRNALAENAYNLWIAPEDKRATW